MSVFLSPSPMLPRIQKAHRWNLGIYRVGERHCEIAVWRKQLLDVAICSKTKVFQVGKPRLCEVKPND